MPDSTVFSLACCFVWSCSRSLWNWCSAYNDTCAF